MDRPAILQRLFQRVEHDAGVCRARRAPADDPARTNIDLANSALERRCG
jgi:hypothetical protein